MSDCQLLKKDSSSYSSLVGQLYVLTIIMITVYASTYPCVETHKDAGFGALWGVGTTFSAPPGGKIQKHCHMAFPVLRIAHITHEIENALTGSVNFNIYHGDCSGIDVRTSETNSAQPIMTFFTSSVCENLPTVFAALLLKIAECRRPDWETSNVIKCPLEVLYFLYRSLSYTFLKLQVL
jgi:hypothetical protein